LPENTAVPTHGCSGYFQVVAHLKNTSLIYQCRHIGQQQEGHEKEHPSYKWIVLAMNNSHGGFHHHHQKSRPGITPHSANKFTLPSKDQQGEENRGRSST